MLSYETESRLKNYLVAVGEGELQLETLRQRLCQICDFSPCMAFQRIDRGAYDQVTALDLYNFFRDHCVHSVSEGDLARIVKFFDNNEDSRLSLNEFEQILLPCEDNCLRRIAQDRPALRVARYENLPLDIERGILNIFESEVQLVRKLDLLKRELETRYDFSPYAAFKAVDKCQEGAINRGNLSDFLRQNGFFATERELTAIIRRMDTSCTGKVTYSDFADFTRAHGSSSHTHSPAASTNSSGRSASASGRKIGKASTLEASSPLRPRASSVNRTSGKKSTKKACCDDCEKPGSPCKDTLPICRPLPLDCYYPYRRYSSRYYPYYCDPISPCDPCSPYYYDPLYRSRICDPICRPLSVCDPICRPVSVCDPICRPLYKPCAPLTSSNEYELVKALYDIIREERDLEAAKINLAKRADFNLYDAFKIFDNISKGYITIADLREGLAAIGVFPTSSDMELYIKRYDKFNERKVRFSEFGDSFTP